MLNKFFSLISSLIYHIPGTISKKIVMIGNILFHDWRINPPKYTCLDFRTFSQYKSIDDLPDISTLDKRSQENIRRFLTLIFIGKVFDQKRYFFNYSGLFEKLSRQERLKLSLKRKNFCERFELILSPGMSLEDCSCCFSHGLSLLPDYITEYVKNKLFIDAGAYIGDSAMSFLSYHPGKILSFEPSMPIFNMLQKNHSKIPELREKCEIFQIALGEDARDLHFCDNLFSCCHEDTNSPLTVKQTTVDAVVAKYDGPVGLIKADIEGMALKMIQGAKTTILRDHPILTIAVYHCPEELFGIRDLLNSWGLQYIYHYEFLDPKNTFELTMIAYPEDLDISSTKISH